MRKSDINKKDTVNPNPKLKRVPYEYNKRYGVSLNELNEGYAFYLASDDKEIYSKIKMLSFKRDMLMNSQKERLKRVKQESEKYYKEFKEIEQIEAEINKMETDLKESELSKAPAVIKASIRLSDLTDERRHNLKTKWGVKKIDFKTVQEICEEENAPIRPVIQKISPETLKKHFTGCNRFIKKDK